MEANLKKLQKINPLLAKLVEGENLSAKESEDLFTTIWLHDLSGHHLAVAFGAIHAKGETADELLGIVNATKALSTTFAISSSKAIDLSGTGAGSFKTFNVSTAASFVVTAAGYTVSKNAYYGITSPTGSADIFSNFGIDIAKLTKKNIEKMLTRIGIAPVYYPFISPKMVNRGELSKKLFGERQLKIRTPYHLVSNIYSPLKMDYRTYGCYSEKYLETLSELFRKLGYKRTLVFHARIGMPEIANVGETVIVEQIGKNSKKYIVTAKDFGIKEANASDIASGTKGQNIADFEAILRGKGTRARTDLVAMNAGAALYALGDIKNFKEGTKKALEILASGKAYQKLENLIISSKLD